MKKINMEKHDSTMNEIHVMIVDDDKDLLDELREVLASPTLHITTFHEGEIALEHAQVKPPDVILLDLKMKGISGFQLADKLRQNELTKDIPIIAISAFYESEDTPGLMMSHGFNRLLTKPIRPTELIRTIYEQLETKQTGGIR